MDQPDAHLADWLTGRQPIPPEADTPMLRQICQAAAEGIALPTPLPPPKNPLPLAGEGRVRVGASSPKAAAATDTNHPAPDEPAERLRP